MKNIKYFIILLSFTVSLIQAQAHLTNDQINDYYQNKNQQYQNYSSNTNATPHQIFKSKMREIKENIHEICMFQFDFDEATLQMKLDQMQDEVNILNALDPYDEKHDRNIRHLNNEIMRARKKCSE